MFLFSPLLRTENYDVCTCNNIRPNIGYALAGMNISFGRMKGVDVRKQRFSHGLHLPF